jgi:type IV pilus assembly protein PilC
MALYQYVAVDPAGKRVRGMQDAANPVDLELRLKRGGLDLISARPARASQLTLGRRVRRQELITFFFNLESLTQAGVPLLESLADLRDTMNDPAFRQIIANMIEGVEGGQRLSQAMAPYPRVFEPVHVSLVRAGEQSGRLAEVFGHITESLKWQDELAAQTRQLMLYPAMVLVVVLAVFLFLMLYLVPQLSGFMQNIGQAVPLQTQLLIAVSEAVASYWYLAAGLLAGAAAGIWLGARLMPGLESRIDGLKLKLWLVGPILHKIILARFANTFAMMYASGISILECIAAARDIAGNRVVAASLEQVGRRIEEGKNLTQSFAEVGLFPPLVLRMLRVGESTGALDKALLNVTYFYDRDVRESVKRIQTMIGPFLTLVLGALIGWVMFSVLMPVYDVISRTRF